MVQNKAKTAKGQEKKDYSLKGTFISVMLLGVFIIISWPVFMLYLFHDNRKRE